MQEIPRVEWANTQSPTIRLAHRNPRPASRAMNSRLSSNGCGLLESQADSKAAFLSLAEEVFLEFAGTLDRGWTTIERIAGGLSN
jgi:hypothetical protein